MGVYSACACSSASAIWIATGRTSAQGSRQVIDFPVNVNGGGEINVDDLHAKDLDVLISGLGDLTIGGGEVADQAINISGGGNYDAARFH